MVAIIGNASPVDIMGVMPGIGLTEGSGMGVRTGIVGTVGMFCMDPIPRETFQFKSLINSPCEPKMTFNIQHVITREGINN